MSKHLSDSELVNPVQSKNENDVESGWSGWFDGMEERESDTDDCIPVVPIEGVENGCDQILAMPLQDIPAVKATRQAIVPHAASRW